jgi:hypothetical protein
MRLTSHFWLHEFERSDTARRLAIDNYIPATILPNVRLVAEMLERVREALWQLRGFECPIVITSGYRALPLNRAIGSFDSSYHVQGLAADWIAPAFGAPTKICRALAGMDLDKLGIGQLINEFPGNDDGEGWVHTGVAAVAPINRVITIDRAADGQITTRPGILESFA